MAVGIKLGVFIFQTYEFFSPLTRIPVKPAFCTMIGLWYSGLWIIIGWIVYGHQDDAFEIDLLTNRFAKYRICRNMGMENIKLVALQARHLLCCQCVTARPRPMFLIIVRILYSV